MKTMNEIRTHLVDKANEDADFRARLLSDPKGAVEEELSVSIPASLSIAVHEDDGTTAHLVLPPDGRLSEADLQMAAGGRSPNQITWEEYYDLVGPDYD